MKSENGEEKEPWRTVGDKHQNYHLLLLLLLLLKGWFIYIPNQQHNKQLQNITSTGREKVETQWSHGDNYNNNNMFINAPTADA